MPKRTKRKTNPKPAHKAKKAKKTMKARARTNGTSRNARSKTEEARARVLKEARRIGVISNQRACEIGKFTQAWYHLNALVEAGHLKRTGYNQWMPVRAR